jgi:hypothetical protein
MKKTNQLCFLIIIFITISCSKENKIQTKINEYVEKNFDDPKSYELIELKLIDTLTTKRAAKYVMDNGVSYIDAMNKYIKEKNKEISDKALSAFLGGPSFGLSAEVDELTQEKAKLLKYNDTILMFQKENTRLKKYLNQNGIVYYRYQHNYRTKNNSGVLIKYTDTVRVDTNDNIIEDYNAFIRKNLEEKSK